MCVCVCVYVYLCMYVCANVGGMMCVLYGCGCGACVGVYVITQISRSARGT